MLDPILPFEHGERQRSGCDVICLAPSPPRPRPDLCSSISSTRRFADWLASTGPISPRGEEKETRPWLQSPPPGISSAAGLEYIVLQHV